MKSYQRREKVARAIQRELGTLIQKGGIKDDRLDKFISIVDVQLNSGLSSAKIIYSIFNNGEDEDNWEIAKISTQAALNANAGYIRGVVGRRLNLKYAPKLIFVAGEPLSKAVDMVNLIDRTVCQDEDHKSRRDEAE